MTDPDKKNAWYTPAKYIEAARLVMGGIDLDPASCEQANQTVKANRYYTKEDNGLMRPWFGRVWMNPPFGVRLTESDAPWCGKSQSGIFIRRLLWEYANNHIEQAVLLAKAAPNQLWFHALWNYPLCFCTKDIYFHRPGQEPSRMQFGVCFAYLGPNESRFIEVFSQFGRIVRAIDVPAPRPIAQELWQEVRA